jgi:hypothetical protein
MSKVFDYPMEDLEIEGHKTNATTATLTLLAMADFASDDGENIYPSIETLCRKTKLGERAIQYCLRALEAHGYISNRGVSRLGTTQYAIIPSALNASELTKRCVLCGESDRAVLHEHHIDKKKSDFTVTLCIKCHRELHTGVHPIPKKSAPDAPKPLFNPLTLRVDNEIVYEDCDEDGNPVRQKKSKQKVRKAGDDRRVGLAFALADVTNMEMKLNRGYLFKEADHLLQDESITPELIKSLYGPGGAWYKKDWRGLKGQPPKPFDVRATVYALQETPAKKDDWGGYG